MSIPYTRTPSTLSIVIAFRPHTIPASHPNFEAISKMVRDPNTTDKDIEPLLNIPKAISTFTGGNVTVVNGRLFYKGYEVKNNLASIILGFVKEGDAEAAKPFERFLEKAFANPDPRAVEGLYDWVVAGGLPITPDGDILAWKAVQNDYLSIHSGPRGKLRHRIGDVVEEPREETDGNPDRTCSRGIHFCSVEYLKSGGYASGGSRIMAVTISPTDVVAFPRDYKLSKGRAARITVVGEVPQADVPTYYAGASRIYSGWTAPAEPAVKKAERNSAGFAVGQVWARRDGKQVTIKAIKGDSSLNVTYPLRDSGGQVYTATGRYAGESSQSLYDLVRLVSDVI
jgi:hypothetical protein